MFILVVRGILDRSIKTKIHGSSICVDGMPPGTNALIGGHVSPSSRRGSGDNWEVNPDAEVTPSGPRFLPDPRAFKKKVHTKGLGSLAGPAESAKSPKDDRPPEPWRHLSSLSSRPRLVREVTVWRGPFRRWSSWRTTRATGPGVRGSTSPSSRNTTDRYGRQARGVMAWQDSPEPRGAWEHDRQV